MPCLRVRSCNPTVLGAWGDLVHLVNGQSGLSGLFGFAGFFSFAHQEKEDQPTKHQPAYPRRPLIRPS